MVVFDWLHISAAIGLFAIFWFFLPNPLLSFYRYFLRPAKNLCVYGDWAVVTGATDGIGKAYAFELARRGLSVLLISRSADKLTQVQQEITSQYPRVTIKTFTLDFDAYTPQARTALAGVLSALDVGVLINNVGVSYDYPDYFHNLSVDQVRQLININIGSTTHLTHLVLPGMLKKKRGAIINLSSLSSLVPSPLLAEYGAAKQYINSFTLSLSTEYSSQGIDFQVQIPSYVVSKMSKVRHSSLLTPFPSTFVRAAAKAIGYETVSIPYWPHAVQAWLIELLPTFIKARAVAYMHQGIRKRAIKKKEKQQSTQQSSTRKSE